MKQKLLLLSLSLLLLWGFTPVTHAQMMGGWGSAGTISAEEKAAVKAEEAQGKAIYEQLQNQTLTCDKVTTEQFELMGEYFMGLMHGDNHAFMNQRLKAMHGVAGEEAIHVNLGKEASGCDTGVSLPRPIDENRQWNGGFGMMGGWGNGNFFSDGLSALTPWLMLMMLFNLIWWVVVIGAIIYFVRWLMKKSNTGSSEQKK